MKIIQVATQPHHRVRQLLSAMADIRLRQIKYLDPLNESVRHPYDRRAWTDREYDIARSMQLKGKSNADIARRLKRSVPAIDRAVGCE